MDAAITIKGGAYFALTPAALMVGGELQATYQSGNLKAWFDAHADFIVRWKPFWFDADIGIVIGASYTIDWGFTTSTISVELGCDLELWGPPTGGSATLDFYVISITIPFGTPKNNTQQRDRLDGRREDAAQHGVGRPASQRAHAQSRGRADPQRHGADQEEPARIAGRGGAGRRSTEPAWIVRGTMFAFTTSSSIPETSATVGAASLNGSKLQRLSAGRRSTATGMRQLGAHRDGSRFQRQGALVHFRRGGGPERRSRGAVGLAPRECQRQAPGAGPRQAAGPEPVDRRDGPREATGSRTVRGLDRRAGEPGLRRAESPVRGAAGERFGPRPLATPPSNGRVTISRIASHENGIASSRHAAHGRRCSSALGRLDYAPDANDPMTRFRDRDGLQPERRAPARSHEETSVSDNFARIAFARLSDKLPDHSAQFYDGYFAQLPAEHLHHRGDAMPSRARLNRCPPIRSDQTFTVRAPEFTIDPATVMQAYPASGARISTTSGCRSWCSPIPGCPGNAAWCRAPGPAERSAAVAGARAVRARAKYACRARPTVPVATAKVRDLLRRIPRDRSEADASGRLGAARVERVAVQDRHHSRRDVQRRHAAQVGPAVPGPLPCRQFAARGSAPALGAARQPPGGSQYDAQPATRGGTSRISSPSKGSRIISAAPGIPSRFLRSPARQT